MLGNLDSTQEVLSEEQIEKKRKREKEAKKAQEDVRVQSIFKKSKKIARSPPDKRTGEEKEMEKILEKLGEIQEELKEIRKENMGLRKEMERLRGEMKKKEERWAEERKKLESRVTSLEKEKEREERKKRKNNIIVRGWQGTGESEEDRKEEIARFIQDKLKEKVEVVRAVALKRKTTMIELKGWDYKMKIMKNKKLLRNHEETKKIFIDNDLTKAEREIQEKIWRAVEEEKRAGKRIRVGYRKAMIGEEEWEWNEDIDKLDRKTFR